MGKSLLLVMLCIACANNVPQDKSTGPDGKVKGAKEIVLQEGVGKQRDVVTYPGGDRIDWKKIVLPEKTKGKLDLKMTYTTPRPDLKANFDVFDQWYHPVKEGVTGRGRNKSLSIDKATGTYFVRVSAPRRTDAASYVIEATFEADVKIDFDITKVPVADPPGLPTVPEPDPQCLVAYDKANRECEKTCAPGSPPKHKGCDTGTVATPPVPPVTPVPPIPVPPPSKPIIARIMSKELQGDGTIIVTLGAGSEHGVGKEWTKGSLLKGDGKDPKAKYANGGITVIQVNKTNTRVKLRQGITSDILKENDKVILEP